MNTPNLDRLIAVVQQLSGRDASAAQSELDALREQGRRRLIQLGASPDEIPYRINGTVVEFCSPDGTWQPIADADVWAFSRPDIRCARHVVKRVGWLVCRILEVHGIHTGEWRPLVGSDDTEVRRKCLAFLGLLRRALPKQSEDLMSLLDSFVDSE